MPPHGLCFRHSTLGTFAIGSIGRASAEHRARHWRQCSAVDHERLRGAGSISHRAKGIGRDRTQLAIRTSRHLGCGILCNHRRSVGRSTNDLGSSRSRTLGPDWAMGRLERSKAARIADQCASIRCLCGQEAERAEAMTRHSERPVMARFGQLGRFVMSAVRGGPEVTGRSLHRRE